MLKWMRNNVNSRFKQETYRDHSRLSIQMLFVHSSNEFVSERFTTPVLVAIKLQNGKKVAVDLQLVQALKLLLVLRF